MVRTAPPVSDRSSVGEPDGPGAGAAVDLGPAALLEAALQRREGLLAVDGSLVVDTGVFTGRSPRDKYLVQEPATEVDLWWGDAANQPMAPAAFERLLADVQAALNGRPRFVQHLSVIADPARAVPVTVVTDQAWAALFSQLLFRPPRPAPAIGGWTIWHAPTLRADPDRHGARSSTVIALALDRRQIVIAGTEYAGEIKKSLFTALQYALPTTGVLTMHCSANLGTDGDAALLFGLSGTGKTSLAIDPNRRLLGDDEHGWDDDGIFNLEGGCYAKVIDLSDQAEPEIYHAVRRFGTLLENVAIDPVTRELDFADGTKTENSRAAFPLEALGNVVPAGMGGHPTTILLLTADAFGVLPPVAKLDHAQALYWFLSGYTAKLAGTERGMTEPEATFSACFGAPFLPLRPARYAALLGDKLAQHRPQVWLVNTGWSGGPAGVGRRMPIGLTRAIVRAILAGTLATVPSRVDPLWGFAVPTRVPDAPDAPLAPKATWAEPDAFDRANWRLAADVIANFQQFAAEVPPEVLAAGPQLPAAP
jgi:phosphoenolpyruvate carboxykinase (ATP)